MGKDAPFIVGTLRLQIFIPDSHSLKEKRQVVKSVKDQIHNRFNVSVSELGSGDKWQALDLGIVACGNDGKHVNAVLSQVENFIRRVPLMSIGNVELEMF